MDKPENETKEELEKLFELQRRADIRAVELWRKMHPDKKLVMPDRCDMVVWLMDECDRLRAQTEAVQKAAFNSLVKRADENDILGDALFAIKQWAEAYPIAAFPEPDLKKAAEVLKANGLSLDSISGYVSRHIIEGVGKIAKDALDDVDEIEEREAPPTLPNEATFQMATAGARSIGNTIGTDNHVERARACWRAMTAAFLDDQEEPIPSGQTKGGN